MPRCILRDRCIAISSTHVLLLPRSRVLISQYPSAFGLTSALPSPSFCVVVLLCPSALPVPHKCIANTITRALKLPCEHPCIAITITHRQLEIEIDRLQRKMMVILLKCPLLPGECPEAYVLRRNKRVSTLCKEHGLWSVRHHKWVLAWRDHITRPANAKSWPAILYRYRGLDWLVQRRLQMGSNPLAGRTGARSSAGHVATRWHDGIRFAELKLG